jgi:hypothetical protein
VLFKIQPYTRANGIVILAAAACFFITWLIPFTWNLYADAVLRTLVFVSLYAFLMIRFKVSEDINNLFYEKVLRRKTLH